MRNLKSKQKILIILSHQNYNNSGELVGILDKINSIDGDILTYTCLVDPPQKEIEHLLYSEDYLCVIPCAQYSLLDAFTNKNQIHGFNIIQLLQRLKTPYVGSDYISNILVNDKATSLKASNMNPPMCVITEYSFTRNCEFEHFSDSEFSISIEPAYENNYALPSNSEEVHKEWSEANEHISTIFQENQNISEILIKGSPKKQRKYCVTLIGSPPNSLELICEISFDQLNSQIDQNTSSPLFSKAVELFNRKRSI